MRKVLGAILLLAFLAPSARPEADADAGPDARSFFQRGRFELQAGGGYGVFDGRSYLLLVAGGGYYLRDGLSAGLSGEAWLGSRPQIYDVSPQIRYVFVDSTWRYKPYAGIFYRRTGYSRQWTPIDSSGGRVGLVFPLNSRAYLTAGGVYEHYFDCNKSVYASCDDVYPEVGLSFVF